MPVDLPKSHVDTPAWQSFEQRMRVRAAERRQQKRDRRLRRLKYAAGGTLALFLGLASAWGVRVLNERGVLDRAVREGNAIKQTLNESLAAASPPSTSEPTPPGPSASPESTPGLQPASTIVVDWPDPPPAPSASVAAAIAAVPLPADWNAGAQDGEPVATNSTSQPGPESFTGSTPLADRDSTLSPGETPDNVMFPESGRLRAAQPPSPSSSRARSDLPGSRAASFGTSREASNGAAGTSAGPLDSSQQVAAATGETGGAAATGRVGQGVSSEPARRPARENLSALEPAPGLASPSASVATSTRNPSAELPLGTSTRNLSTEPPVGTSSGNPSTELPLGTSTRNLSAEPPVGTSSRNPSAEPPVGTSSRNPSAEPSVGSTGRRLSDPRESVRAVLDRYRSAYQRLDASAARAVWPAVDSGALARAFGALESQVIRFEACSIDVADSTADATCRGESRVIPKIGGGTETARRTWQFKLRQAGNDWIIDRATVK